MDARRGQVSHWTASPDWLRFRGTWSSSFWCEGQQPRRRVQVVLSCRLRCSATSRFPPVPGSDRHSPAVMTRLFKVNAQVRDTGGTFGPRRWNGSEQVPAAAYGRCRDDPGRSSSRYGRSSRWVRENRARHPVTCGESAAGKAVAGGRPSLRELAEGGHSEPDAPSPTAGLAPRDGNARVRQRPG